MNVKELPVNSRIWIFSSSRFLTQPEQSLLSENLNQFLQKWAAHGKELFGAFEIYHDNFIVVGVDESKIPASGCSIDTLTHFIKQQGQILGVDFFNRMKLLITRNGELKRINFSELSNFPEWEVFDPTITNLAKFESHWLIPVKEFIQ